MDVLIADDDRGTLLTVRTAVEALGHSVRAALNGAEAWAMFGARRPDILITDWSMPGLDGTKLSELVRSEASDAYTYILVLTGEASDTDALVAMYAGADDVMRKPLDRAALERKLIAAGRLVTTYGHDASHSRADTVTGLPPLRAADHEFSVLRARRQRYGGRSCVLIVDVDGFSAFNAAGGAGVGNSLLNGVAGVLADKLGSSASVYRMGADRFLVLLPDHAQHEAVATADRIRAGLRALRVRHPQGGLATASVAVAPVSSRLSFDQIQDVAAEALAAAKKAGGNRTELADCGSARRAQPAPSAFPGGPRALSRSHG